MAREPEELVEMRRALGVQLAVFRHAAGLTQDELAHAAFCDRSTVAHIEKGRSRGDERFWMVVDERCGAGGVLRAAFQAWERARQEHEVRLRQAQLAEAQARADALRAATAPQLMRNADVAGTAGQETAGGKGQIVEQLVTLLCELVGAMNRRKLLELLRLLGSAVGTVVASPVFADLDPGERERMVRAVGSPSRVDEQIIDHIDAILQDCKRQHDALGSRAVLDTALGQRNLVRDLLPECSDTLRPRLLSTYSDMSTSIGFYYFDLNDFDRSWYCFDQARAAAWDADDTELSIYALCQMSYVAGWQGKTPTAIDTVAAARSLLVKTGDPLMRVCVADKTARAYAIDGQSAECMAEMEAAQDGLASVGQAPTESTAYWYNQGLLLGARSYCLLQLGKPQDAAIAASTGLELLDDSYVDKLAYCGVFLGKAHLQSGEVEEAARVVGDAAGLAAKTRSVRLVTELRATRTRMQPWQGTQAVAVLDDQLKAYGLAPATFG
ncbi:MAG: helix-turn-helix transcriptional regulator [Pseudonocardiaceae bacterium]